jgi:uncharacterized membrane protein
MSDLIAVAYPDEGTAAQARDTLMRLQREHLIELEDAVVVIRGRDGKVRLDQAFPTVETGLARGMIWGTLIGVLFFAPWLGLLVGGATGALAGKLSDYGIEDRFMEELGRQLKPGTSALFVLVRKATPDKVLDEVRKYGGTVLRSSLTKDAEERLQQALQQGAGATGV